MWRRFAYDDPNAGWEQGHINLYRFAGGTWTRQAVVRAIDTEYFAFGLSGDGNTVVCTSTRNVDVFTAPDWQRVARLPNRVHTIEYSNFPRSVAVNHDGTRFAARTVERDASFTAVEGFVSVFRRGANGWALESKIPRGDWMQPDSEEFPPGEFALGLAMNRDGSLLAVGAPTDTAIGTGVLYPPINGGQNGNGATYVFESKPSGWRLRHVIKPNTSDNWQRFGWSLDFARNGKDLLVGAPGVGMAWLY